MCLLFCCVCQFLSFSSVCACTFSCMTDCHCLFYAFVTIYFVVQCLYVSCFCSHLLGCLLFTFIDTYLLFYLLVSLSWFCAYLYMCLRKLHLCPSHYLFLLPQNKHLTKVVLCVVRYFFSATAGLEGKKGNFLLNEYNSQKVLSFTSCWVLQQNPFPSCKGLWSCLLNQVSVAEADES